MVKRLTLVILSIFILASYTELHAVSKHHQTTADPKTGELVLNIMGQEISINLQSPSTYYTTYPDGQLQHLVAVVLSDYYEVDFYHQDHVIKEKVALIQRYSITSGYKILDGPSQRFNFEGNLINESNWSKGKLNGLQRIYHSGTGQLLEERDYALNYPINHWVSYYPNGTIASEIQFPESDADWLATEITGPKGGSENELITASYPHPLSATQIWYYPNGSMLKQKKYSFYKHNEQIVVIDDGTSTSYNAYGRIVGVQNAPNGNGESFISINSYGLKYTEKTTWFNNAIFKIVQTQEFLRP